MNRVVVWLRWVMVVGVVLVSVGWVSNGRASSSSSSSYSVEVLSVGTVPVVSYLDGTSMYQQAFNPSIVVPLVTGKQPGLIVRSQNCTAVPGGECTYCSGADSHASVLTLASLKQSSDLCTDPVFDIIDKSTIVFSPEEGLSMEKYGTEDPRIAYDKSTGLYYMFYTCYGPTDILLCLATTMDPTSPDGWTRVGPIFPDQQGSKSGALLIRESGPHYLFWGAGEVRVTTSKDPTVWPSIGDMFLQPRADNFDSQGVESGPPPLLLSDGNYFFIYNSWNNTWPTDPTAEYHPAWVILDGTTPSTIIQRASEPFMHPTQAWEQGVYPYTCNAPRVVFVEAAVACGDSDDVFRIFYGGADAVVGTALIHVSISQQAK
ncbi:family 43 glycosylhydrolase [Pelomyxa schiedti]|nr:family 43 glycosylhydrolase [Pelomyxa schiedti]